MKIYTKTGDQGTTSLVGGERVFKTDERVEAYGSVDELTAFVALLTDHLRGDVGLEPRVWELARIASQLMTVAATLAVGEGGADKVKGIDAEAVKFLEEAIDRMQASVKPITKFTIPGGHRVVSLCHVCRTVCRRAERAALRCEVWRRTGGTDVPQPAVGLFLSAGPHADRIFQRGGNPVDSVTGFYRFFSEFRTICRGVFFFVCRKDPTRPMRLKCR